MGKNFDQDPLGWLDDTARDGRGARWLSPRAICIYDAAVAREMLRNDGGRMVDHSDFFGNGPSAPARHAQIAIARQTLALVQDHVRTVDCRRFVAALRRQSEWPRAGNALLLEIMRPVLAAPWRTPAFHRALDTMVAGRILGRHEKAVGLIRRIRNRFGFYRTVVGESTKTGGQTSQPDLLEIIRSQDRHIDEKALVHLYAGIVFATVGSVGFALGWAVLQSIRERKMDQSPAQLVLEALRLYPVAWLFERRLREPQTILGERILPTHSVLISPYAVHRNPTHWDEPTDFVPERWSTRADRSAYLPFGAGEHGCVAAGFSIGLASRLLEEILACDPEIEMGSGGPSLGAALASPRFTLRLRSTA